MSNSKLVSYTMISPNSSARTSRIDRITIHHMGSTALTIEACGAGFARTERMASSNYGVGTDGRIALYVDESRRSWCSSNWKNDDRAVTIEVQNDTKDPDWHVSDKALEATIELCADICRRNGIEKLNYTGDTNGNLTMHKWFAATGCPGPYLSSKFPYIAAEVNKRLGVTESAGTKEEKYIPVEGTLSVGDTISLLPGSKYTNGKNIPTWVYKNPLYVRDINGENITFSTLKVGAITGVVSKNCIKFGNKSAAGDSNVNGNVDMTKFAVGDVVKLSIGAKYTNGKSVPAWVTKKQLYIRQIYNTGDIVVSIYKTGAITGAVPPKYITKVK